ncbi:MAG: thioredoxin family protein [Euryarchaeota archaeon]|nr:thioredoxin family protein [Euryarchaeota archaeon]
MKGVILLVAEWSTECAEAKLEWRRLQEVFEFDYKEVDLESKEGQRLARRHCITTVPTLLINGEVAFTGCCCP